MEAIVEAIADLPRLGKTADGLILEEEIGRKLAEAFPYVSVTLEAVVHTERAAYRPFPETHNIDEIYGSVALSAALEAIARRR